MRSKRPLLDIDVDLVPPARHAHIDAPALRVQILQQRQSGPPASGSRRLLDGDHTCNVLAREALAP
ncbi:hypothetical protein ATY81_17680 [Rhizobium sp. R72]|nr:hypothetical protein ATY81_17680 [Rhizobium sp. R72]OWW04356.1 hypothetical protein ATY80_17680 [Rhizobium sp. R711]